ncbi:MAG: STAS domain-containing protein [Desulfobacula sp.]|jgi:anti-anti-sigma factor|uniref:MBL fold metallo-hydrolase n=1 Tax=Desulfobacula sp. TaxID=2593537 RepID=UPI001DA045DB|nr:STAS domain-containing protein [Desulfobacula sp.]MBT3486009.1 STAS domain-containing protein [Desulfobacula sp.]MBT3804033.1 STAS domain-containing protein [Desulfobacula sp.]MBT4026998.1 STAS domain-containing protein [Desulfobacula sp.]MBT4200586.1 STAS domain-containing protein [Desulfobacula sp.]
MEVLFWGTRGSLPSAVTAETIKKKIKSSLSIALEKKLTSYDDLDRFVENHLPFSVSSGYGCNTSCVEIIGGKESVICDAGSGLRDYGTWVMKNPGEKANQSGQVFNIFLSHLHWDHIHGFPFFTPAYIPGNTVNIFGFHENIEEMFKKQQAEPCFPVPLEALAATINFTTLDLEKEHNIAGFKVSGIEQNHPGKSYGYAFEQNNRKIIYSTDAEHKMDKKHSDEFIRFCKDADVSINDAQYQLFDAIEVKENWGHSSNIVVTELSARSNVKQMCMFHHEPTCDDADLDKFLKDTREYLKLYDESSSLIIDLAYDGMRITLEEEDLIEEKEKKAIQGMETFIEEKDDVLIFNLAGRMDGVTCMDLEESFPKHMDSGKKGFILNMKSLDYISSAGLRSVLLCNKMAAQANKQFLICELNGMVMDVFKIAGFASFMNLDFSLKQSLEKINES